MEACSFLKNEQMGEDLGESGSGGDLGGLEGEEFVVWICCMSEESIFNFKKCTTISFTQFPKDFKNQNLILARYKICLF